MKSYTKFLLKNVLVIVAILLLCELGIAYLLNHSERIPESWMDGFRAYYMKKDRRIVQYEKGIAQYDAHLFYKLRSGVHTFSNREFETELDINSAGFRADEADLDRPEIIFLGDSYTMGWGVENAETYCHLLETRTGLRTLNTGISSYGTVRECQVLAELYTSNLRYLIIQYAFNDFGENSEYFFNNSRFVASSQDEYNAVQQSHEQAIRYFPFKHTSHFLRNWFEQLLPAPTEFETASEEAETPYVDQWKAFVNVLQHTEIPSEVEIIVFQVDNNDHQDVFLDPLRENLLKSDSLLRNKLHVLDLQILLHDEHYFPLDQHLNIAGNKLVGDTLAGVIRSLEMARPKASGK